MNLHLFVAYFSVRVSSSNQNSMLVRLETCVLIICVAWFLFPFLCNILFSETLRREIDNLLTKFGK